MKKTSITAFLLVILFNFTAWSYGTHLNSSKILKPGEYDISTLGQFYSDDRRGVFAAAMIDLPFSSETNWRIYGGAGSFDYAFGAQLKWVPIEQIKKNLFSLGFTFGADYGRDDGFGFLLTRATPFISHEFGWDNGTFEPYLALPTGNITVDSESDFYMQAAVGTHVNFENLNYMRFSIEGGFNVENAESYLALMATLQLTHQ